MKKINKKGLGVGLIVTVVIAIMIMFFSSAIIAKADSGSSAITNPLKGLKYDFDGDGTKDLLDKCPCNPQSQEGGSCTTEEYICNLYLNAYYLNDGRKVFLNDCINSLPPVKECKGAKSLGAPCGEKVYTINKEGKRIFVGEDLGFCNTCGQCLSYCDFCNKYPINDMCYGEKLKRNIDGQDITGFDAEKFKNNWAISDSACLCTKEMIDIMKDTYTDKYEEDVIAIGSDRPNKMCYSSAADASEANVQLRGSVQPNYYCCSYPQIRGVELVKLQKNQATIMEQDCKEFTENLNRGDLSYGDFSKDANSCLKETLNSCLKTGTDKFVETKSGIRICKGTYDLFAKVVKKSGTGQGIRFIESDKGTVIIFTQIRGINSKEIGGVSMTVDARPCLKDIAYPTQTVYFDEISNNEIFVQKTEGGKLLITGYTGILDSKAYLEGIEWSTDRNNNPQMCIIYSRFGLLSFIGKGFHLQTSIL